jgi:hypothetical protein
MTSAVAVAMAAATGVMPRPQHAAAVRVVVHMISTGEVVMPRYAGYRPCGIWQQHVISTGEVYLALAFFVGVYRRGRHAPGAGYCPCDFAAMLRGCRVLFSGRVFCNLARAIQTIVHSRSSAAE